MSDWDNTAPTAIPAAAGMNNGAPTAIAAAAAPDNTAPTAIAAAAGMNNGAPTAIAAAAAANNGAPSAVAATTTGTAWVGDTTEDSPIITNVSPADIAALEAGMGVRGAGIPVGATISAIGADTVTISEDATATAVDVPLRALESPAVIAAAAGMNNGAPTAIPAAAAANNGAPTAVAADAAMSGAAPTAIAAAAAADNTGPDAITAATASTNQPPQFFIDSLDAPTDPTVNTPQIVIGGALVADAIHGQTRITAASALTRIQVQLDDPPTGGPAVLQLVDADGNAIAATVTVLAGQRFGELVLLPAGYVGLAANADVRVKCVTPGLTNPGGFGAVTLFLQLT